MRPPTNILLIRPGGIGDAVLLAPAIAALKTKFPATTITVLVEKRNAGVFAMVRGIERVLRYDVPAEFLAAFRLRPDLVIDTEQYHRLSAVVARLTGATTLIGFATNERARLFHHAIPYSHDDYEAESFGHLLAPLGITLPATLDVPFLAVPPQAQARAAQLLAPLAGRPFVALFPGASIPERRWGSERFTEVASRLSQHGYGIVVIGGREDTAASSTITQAAGLNLAGQTTLAESAAILAQSALLVSGDSGVLHLGVGVGTPTVSLFGPGIAKKWAPQGPRHRVINQEFPCSPCTRFGYTARCPRQAACLQQITPAMVTETALSLLASTR
jgi:lipopolysaccharide heptosyltransferase II